MYYTEPPFSGAYTDHFEEGTYLCSSCSIPLYTSTSKFHSGCGWPSFDQEIHGSIDRLPDPDGHRIEIRCHHCHAHLGHLFHGEGFTPTNTRHCINSYALRFVKAPHNEVAYFGTGCFWCSEALFRRMPGVLHVTPGYAGGHTPNPSYKEVCQGTTGHAEVVRVEFDPQKVDYKQLLNLFWASHDPTSLNRQGHDEGEQYRSILLYTNNEQKEAIERSKQKLETSKTYLKPIVTQIVPLETFFEAEPYHKDYYERHPNEAYCQRVIKPKLDKTQYQV